MMKVKDGQCRVAVAQAEPVMFDKKACLSKALSLLQKAAKGGANLVVFPELFYSRLSLWNEFRLFCGTSYG